MGERLNSEDTVLAWQGPRARLLLGPGLQAVTHHSAERFGYVSQLIWTDRGDSKWSVQGIFTSAGSPSRETQLLTGIAADPLQFSSSHDPGQC